MKFLCFHLEDGIFIIFHATFSLYVLLESLRDAIPSSWSEDIQWRSNENFTRGKKYFKDRFIHIYLC